MTGSSSRWIVLAIAALCGGSLVVLSQTPNIQVGPNERHVKPELNVQDGSASRSTKLWVLDFKFKDPRITKVNIPGRGERVVWYLWYQIYNNTGQQVTFVPDFELVTHDLKENFTLQDQIMPAAQEHISGIEDQTGYDKIKNSVTISSDPIPPSMPKAVGKPITGVAIWVDPNEINPDDTEETKARKKKKEKLADSNHYSIFVAGLSNGWSATDPVAPDKNPIIRRKTLQLTFQRMGDQYKMKSEEIRFKRHDWIYRGSSLKVELQLSDDKKDKK